MPDARKVDLKGSSERSQRSKVPGHFADRPPRWGSARSEPRARRGGEMAASLSFGAEQLLAALERCVVGEAQPAGWLAALVEHDRPLVETEAGGRSIDATHETPHRRCPQLRRHHLVRRRDRHVGRRRRGVDAANILKPALEDLKVIDHPYHRPPASGRHRANGVGLQQAGIRLPGAAELQPGNGRTPSTPSHPATHLQPALQAPPRRRPALDDTVKVGYSKTKNEPTFRGGALGAGMR